MDTQKIALLLEVIKIGSLKRAAETLNYTQSGLIYQINSLEQEIGVPLLIRNHKGVSLTSAGRALEAQFRELVENEARLRSEIEHFTKQGTDELRLGVIVSALNSWLPEILKSYQEKYPHVKINIYCGISELPAWLDSELIDLAIVPKHMSVGYHWRFLHKDTICACIPASFPIAQQESVTYEALMQYPLLNPAYAETSAYSEVYQKLGIQSRHELPGVQISSTDGATLFPLVGSGLGITFLSDSYLSVCPSTVAMVPLDPLFHREIGIITSHNRTLTPAARNFVAQLQANIND